MALPVTLSNISNPASSAGNIGPFKVGSNYYIIGFSTVENAIGCWKATDPTSAFTEQDTADRPLVGSTIQALAAVVDGTLIHVACQNSGSTWYARFDTSTDQWVDRSVYSALGSGFFAYQIYLPTNVPTIFAVDIDVRSDGDVIIVYHGENPTTMGGTYQEIAYSRWEGGTSWTHGVVVASKAAKNDNYYHPSVVMGGSDQCHFIFSDDVTSDVMIRSLSSANALRTLRTKTGSIGSQTPTDGFHFAVGKYSRSGTEYIVGQAVAANLAQSLGPYGFRFPHYTDDTNPTLTSYGTISGGVGSSGNTSSDNPEFQTGLAIDADATNQDVHCGFFDRAAGTGDIFLTSDGGTGTWAALNSGSAIRAGSVVGISANIYVRGGNYVYAFVYDDAGTIKYDEFILRSAGPTTITGTGAGTIAAITGAGTGSVLATVTGTGAGTTAAITGAGTGTIARDGTGAGTIAAITGSATGARVVTGTGAGTIGGVQAISFVGWVGAPGANSVSLTSLSAAGSPTGTGDGGTIQEGDVVFVTAATASNTTRNSTILTSGYTQIATDFRNNTSDLTSTVSYKVMGATPDTAVQKTYSGSSTDAEALIAVVLRGVDSIAPDDGFTPLEVYSSSSSDVGLITPNTAGAWYLAAYWHAKSVGTGADINGPANMTQVGRSGNSDSYDLNGVFSYNDGLASSFNPDAVTLSGQAGSSGTGYGWVAKPASGGAPVTGTGSGTVSATVNGTGAGTTPAATGTGAGLRETGGTHAASTSPVTGTGAGTIARDGTGAGTIAAITGTGVGERIVTGTGAGTTAAVTGAGTGVRDITGTGSIAAPAATGAGSGVVNTTITGTGSISTPPVTTTGAGAVGNVISGSGSISTPAVTTTGTGTIARDGTGAGTIAAVTSTGVGLRVITGSGAGTTPAATGTGTGTTGTGPVTITGTGAGTIAAVTTTGTGERTIKGTHSATISLVTGAGTGAVARDGTGSISAPVVTGAGTGAVARDGTGAGTIAAVTSTGVGLRVITGSGAGTTPAITGAGEGQVGVVRISGPGVTTGTGDGILPTDTLGALDPTDTSVAPGTRTGTR